MGDQAESWSKTVYFLSRTNFLAFDFYAAISCNFRQASQERGRSTVGEIGIPDHAASNRGAPKFLAQTVAVVIMVSELNDRGMRA